ncbi:hypothetical protein D3C81_1876760 [compost metagenome]
MIAKARAWRSHLGGAVEPYTRTSLGTLAAYSVTRGSVPTLHLNSYWNGSVRLCKGGLGLPIEAGSSGRGEAGQYACKRKPAEAG